MKGFCGAAPTHTGAKKVKQDQHRTGEGMRKTLKDKLKLENQIEEELLDIASFWAKVTTSDLQGIAAAKTQKIISLVKTHLDYTKIINLLTEARDNVGANSNITTAQEEDFIKRVDAILEK